MTDWQPIETAPESGEKYVFVLVWAKDETPTVASFSEGDRRYPHNWDLAYAGQGAEDATLPFFPTHWMPIPAPPQS